LLARSVTFVTAQPDERTSIATSARLTVASPAK
jgi:hypothetical protein